MCLLFRLKQDFPHFFHARQFHISIVIYCYARIQIAIWRMNNVKSKKKSSREKEKNVNSVHQIKFNNARPRALS